MIFHNTQMKHWKADLGLSVCSMQTLGIFVRYLLFHAIAFLIIDIFSNV